MDNLRVDAIYAGLWRHFQPLVHSLDDETKTTLDGKLWSLAIQLDKAGVKEWPPIQK